ncbi:hypothetical protein BS78_K008700 [Paspalum vaginatum]|uniref:Dynamin-type G domain-containing protein n=1 Tax=Paspalum vaginatum TaxID=158149 RepID=A0A9W7XDE6_9POAL|nr:hypothetical protein BS78_K008700 [Paspalum vaginatum]
MARPSISSSAAAAEAHSKSRFEAYSRLQAAAVAFGEKFPIPEIVAIGGQSDGKSTLLEALLGFRFNVREVEMGTRRPLTLQMVHDPTALEPRCRFQEEDSEEYGSPMVLGTDIAALIKQRTESHLEKIQAAVSSKPIVMRAEYAHCPNFTIIDTPGFKMEATRGEPKNTPDEIRSMVKTFATPPHRLILFLQQSSVEWCSSLWLNTLREIDPTFSRTIIVISKFDNRLKEFKMRWEVDTFLGARGRFGDNTRPFFVALPNDCGTSNEDFRRQICELENRVLRQLQDDVKGAASRSTLESELHNRYKAAAPATLALLQQRCGEIGVDLTRLDMKLTAMSDVSRLKRLAVFHVGSICNHMLALLDGTNDPDPGQFGITTEDEQVQSGIHSWPGIDIPIKPTNSDLKLYGGAAFDRVVDEFFQAAYSKERPQLPKDKVANILLAHAKRGGSSAIAREAAQSKDNVGNILLAHAGRGGSEAAAAIAREAAQSWLSPLLDTACDRLAFVLQNLFELALVRKQNRDSKCKNLTSLLTLIPSCLHGYHLFVEHACSSKDPDIAEDMGGYIRFQAAIRCSYCKFVNELSRQCKNKVQGHLDTVTSPCLSGAGTLADSFDLSDSEKRQDQQSTSLKDQDLSSHVHGGKHKDIVITNAHGRMEKRARIAYEISGPLYSTICKMCGDSFFAIMRKVLIENNVHSAFESGFITPWRRGLFMAIFLDLFAVSDEKFMDMFDVPSGVDSVRNERHSLLERQKILVSCLKEFTDPY